MALAETQSAVVTENAADIFAQAGERDLMWSLTSYVFPDEVTAWTIGHSIFSSTLAMIGGLFIGWMVISGIVHTAYSGKVLGTRWHQIWAPLRVILGFGLLVPIQSNGLSAVDLVEKLVFNGGRAVANDIANAGIKRELKDGVGIAPGVVSGRDLAQQIAKAEVCSFAYEMAWKRSEVFHDGGRPTPPPAADGVVIVKPAEKSWWPWGKDTPAKITGTIWDYGVACGAFSFSAPTTDEFGDFGETRRLAVAAMIQEIRDLNFSAGLKKHFEKSGPAFRAEDVTLKNMEDLRKRGLLTVNLLPALNAIGDEFNKKIALSARENSKKEHETAKQTVVDGIDKFGWFLLSTSSRVVGRAGEKGYGFAGERAGHKAPDPKAWGAYKDEIAAITALVDAQLETESHDLAKIGEAMRAIDKDASILADITEGISKPVREYALGYDGFRPDPVGDMTNLGHNLVIASEAGFATATVAVGAASVMSAVSQSPQKIVEFVMVPGWWILSGAFLGGAVLAYVLPMIPYIFFVFTAVVIAMEMIAFSIAGKLWAFQHLRMDGEEFVNSHQAIGYQLLFSLGLRQPITVLSYFGVNSVSVWAQNLLLKTWSLAILAAQGNESFGLVALIFGFVMMVYLQWHIQFRTYGLMLEITTRVAAILGHHVASWGDQGHGDAAVAGSVAILAGNSRMRSMGGSRQQNKPKSEENSGSDGVRSQRSEAK